MGEAPEDCGIARFGAEGARLVAQRRNSVKAGGRVPGPERGDGGCCRLIPRRKRRNLPFTSVPWRLWVCASHTSARGTDSPRRHGDTEKNRLGKSSPGGDPSCGENAQFRTGSLGSPRRLELMCDGHTRGAWPKPLPRLFSVPPCLRGESLCIDSPTMETHSTDYGSSSTGPRSSGWSGLSLESGSTRVVGAPSNERAWRCQKRRRTGVSATVPISPATASAEAN